MTRVLLVGAGATGCELLSQLILCHATLRCSHITIVDYDTIETSNLSRQMLYRASDIGHHKAERAAAWVSAKNPTVSVDYHIRPIEDLDVSLLMDHQLVLCAVDCVVTRLWLSSELFSLQSPAGLVELGTEGWMGHVRKVYPHRSDENPCLHCTRSLYPSPNIPQPTCSLGIPTSSNDQNEHLAPLASIVSTSSLVAGLALLVARQLLEKGHNSSSDPNFWFFNGQSSFNWNALKLLRDPQCPFCGPVTS
jgi:molybdopterin/thiamine biosynthesis adenylyltransferase